MPQMQYVQTQKERDVPEALQEMATIMNNATQMALRNHLLQITMAQEQEQTKGIELTNAWLKQRTQQAGELFPLEKRRLGAETTIAETGAQYAPRMAEQGFQLGGFNVREAQRKDAMAPEVDQLYLDSLYQQQDFRDQQQAIGEENLGILKFGRKNAEMQHVEQAEEFARRGETRKGRGELRKAIIELTGLSPEMKRNVSQYADLFAQQDFAEFAGISGQLAKIQQENAELEQQKKNQDALRANAENDNLVHMLETAGQPTPAGATMRVFLQTDPRYKDNPAVKAGMEVIKDIPMFKNMGQAVQDAMKSPDEKVRRAAQIYTFLNGKLPVKTVTDRYGQQSVETDYSMMEQMGPLFEEITRRQDKTGGATTKPSTQPTSTQYGGKPDGDGSSEQNPAHLPSGPAGVAAIKSGRFRGKYVVTVDGHVTKLP